MSIKKHRQQWLLDKARGQQCTAQIEGVCNHNPETTVAAHVQLPGMGIMGGKGHDLHVAWLCSACHDEVDGRTRILDREFVRAAVYEAVLRTQSRLFAMLSDKERHKLAEAL